MIAFIFELIGLVIVTLLTLGLWDNGNYIGAIFGGILILLLLTSALPKLK